MIRIIHTADIHLDSPLRALALRDTALRDRVQNATRRAFEKIVDAALEERATALLISGDLFDGAARSAQSAAFVLTQLDRLAESGTRVFWIKGNHDAENPLTGELTLPDNTHVFDARGGKVEVAPDVWVHGVSFAKPHAPESLVSRFSEPVLGAVNIAMLHTSLNGAPGHDPYAPCSVAELAATGFDYWALGHIHKRMVHSEAPWIVMPGTPQGRDIGETGPKSATLLEIEGRTISTRALPTSVLEYRAETLDISGVEHEDDVRALLRDKARTLAEQTSSDNLVLRLTLQGDSPLRWTMLRDHDTWSETTRQILQATRRIWLDKLVLDLDAQLPHAGTPTAMDALAQSMARIQSEDGFQDQWQRTVEDLLDALNNKAARDRLAADEDSLKTLAQTTAKDGAALMLARMKGADG